MIFQTSPKCLLFAAVLSLGTGSAAVGSSRSPNNGQMAPVASYLMERSQEISLARSAAPHAISGKATILVLTPSGYETAVEGSNGFLCWVVRSFGGAPDAPERWNPKIRAAECLNPAAARSIAPIVKLRTSMVLAGRSDAEFTGALGTALNSKAIPPLEPGAVSYMMSKRAYLQDQAPHYMAHVMFFIPSRDGKEWAANAPDSPFVGGNYWYFTPGHEADIAKLPPISVLITRVGNWSDGTPASHGM